MMIVLEYTISTDEFSVTQILLKIKKQTIFRRHTYFVSVPNKLKNRTLAKLQNNVHLLGLNFYKSFYKFNLLILVHIESPFTTRVDYYCFF